jgi:hypothetical protein
MPERLNGGWPAPMIAATRWLAWEPTSGPQRGSKTSVTGKRSGPPQPATGRLRDRAPDGAGVGADRWRRSGGAPPVNDSDVAHESPGLAPGVRPVAVSALPDAQPARVATVLRLQRAIGNRAVSRLISAEAGAAVRQAISRPRMLQRAVHSDADLMKVMQAFRSDHKWLGTDEQNKIFWAIKRATDSDEVAYAYFDHYSGITGQRIVKADGQKLADMKSKGRIGDTAPGGDSYFDPSVFAPGYNDADLGALLLHEFGHSGHKTYGDYQEGQTYGVQYFYAEHAGGSPDMLRIRGLISTWPGSEGLAVKSLFKITYAVMTELQKLKTTGTSTLPPLSGLNADDGKTLMAKLITAFGALNEDPPSGPLAPLWTYVRDNIAKFVVPAI